MLNNIIFLSNKNEIDLLGDYYNKDSIIFSLHNSISIELDKRNIDYVYPENYIDLEKFLKITLSNYEIVNNICTKIDQYVQKIIYLNHFNLCKRMFFHFELLINTIIAYYLMIESVVKKNPSKNIIYVENDENLYNIDTLFYDDETRIFQKIISVIAKSNNIPVIVVKFLKENNKYINKEVIKIKKKPKGILFRIKSLFTKNNFIICDYGHDIPYLIRELKKNVFINEFNLVTKERIYSLVNSNIKNNIDLKLSEIYEYFVEKIHEIIKIISIGFFEIIEPFIFMWVYKILPEYIKIFEYYNKFFNTCRQIIILTSTTNLAYYHLAVFDAAKSKQKKIITYQEGAGYGSPDVKVYDYSEYRNCDYFISYGELSSYLKKKKIMNTCKILEAGSLRLKKLKCDLHNNMDLKYKILYCTSYNPVRNHFPYNFSFSNYSYKLQKDISNLLESLNVKAAVQVAPNNAFNVIDKYILNNKSLFNKLDVIQNKKFVSVLPITEAVIIDFPSTTLMEALITEKPIFFYYSNWLSHIDDDALFLLKKRVCVIESLEKLKQNLFKYFRYNLYEADITNKEYFEKYCLNEKNKKCEELLLNFFTKFNKNIEK